MHYHNYTATKQAERDEALLAVGVPVILYRGRKAVKELIDLCKVDPVPAHILSTLRFIPFVCHNRM